MPVTIRTADAAEHNQILDCVRSAFATGGRDGSTEVAIVRRTWALAAAPPGLELVAVEGSKIVGHVIGARGRLEGREVIGLAPLAVRPAEQGKGIGSALATELLRRAEVAGWPLVVLLGDPGYYRRFGFEPSGPLGIVYAPVGEGDPHFQVRRFGGYEPTLKGEFTYWWEH